MSRGVEGFLTPIKNVSKPVPVKNSGSSIVLDPNNEYKDKEILDEAIETLSSIMKINSLKRNEDGLDALCALVYRTGAIGDKDTVRLNIDSGFVSNPTLMDATIYLDAYIARIAASLNRSIKFDNGFTMTIFYGRYKDVKDEAENDYMKQFFSGCGC